MGLNTDVLRSSFELVGSRRPDFTAPFYDNLFTAHPEARELFTRNDPATQQKMLAEALVAVMDHLEDAPWLQQTLNGMGAQHVEYGVREEMYDWVGAALLQTLAEIAGDEWSPEVESAWVDAYGAISSLMKEGASASQPQVSQAS